MKDYICYIEEKIKDKKTNSNELKEDILVHLEFFKHERLIHLLVTMLVSIITTIILITTLFVDNILLLILLLIFIVLLFFYMKHYYFLENNVQYIYTLYNRVNKK